jgi:hypothetical protein
VSQWQSAGPPIAATSADDGEDPDGHSPVLVDVATSPALPGKRRLSMRVPGGNSYLQAVLPDGAARKIGFPLVGVPEPAPVTVTPQVGDWQAFLRDLDRINDRFHRSSAGLPDYGVPYLPLPERLFLPLLFEAIRHTTGRAFLDVGCGPGTKMRLVEAFGFTVYGIDYLQAHVDEANRGRDKPRAWQYDARSFGWYPDYDLLLLNRPMEGPEQESLELTVMEGMRRGAVLINVNGCVDPGTRLGWTAVSVTDPGPVDAASLIAVGVPDPIARQLAEQSQVVNGAWQKPAT